MVRDLAVEEELINDAGPYTSGGGHDWTERVAKEISLTAKSMVYIKFTTSTNVSTHGAGRVKNSVTGDVYVSTGGIGTSDSVEKGVFTILAAGNHQLSFQSSSWAGGVVTITNIVVGVLDFSDRNETGVYSGSVVLDDGETSGEYQLIYEDISLPTNPERKLAIGTIKKYTVILTVCCFASGYRMNEMLNTGESTTGGKSGFQLWINASHVNWTERVNDDNDGNVANSSFGEGSYARYIFTVDADTPLTGFGLWIKANNELGVDSITHYAYAQVVVCPWIIPNVAYEPISLNVPQGSTIYIITEPLDANPTKHVKIGKERFVSFGDAADYYYMDSGTNILESSYTFEAVEVEDILLFISGYGGCVSTLAVDVR
jgi:hypothetical protein